MSNKATREDFDRQMMRLALRAAGLGLGRTAPNPSVGAVIADEDTGEIVSVATTAHGGRPHAEPLAIQAAGERARGRTMYVTLEPCSHVGRTAPCADAVLEAGLRRVVVAQEDPDPRVSGRGMTRLRNGGLNVELGLMRGEARWLTRGHIVRVTERRPFVQLKLALDRDGSVPEGTGSQPVFVTGDIARAQGHLLRARADAIMVGMGTVRSDDPQLTCRLPGLSGWSPVRVILAGSDLPDPSCRLAATAGEVPVWVMATTPVLSGQQRIAQALRDCGCRLFAVGEVGGRPWLPSVLEALVGQGITRLLVEGGPALWRTFSTGGFADEAVIFHSGGAARAASWQATQLASVVERHLPGAHLALKDRRTAGDDAMMILRNEFASPRLEQ